LEGISKREPFESEAPEPPPLCSLCQHKAPCFGKPPQSFSYRELHVATAGFSRSNFLAEGGYGYVHQGILPDGQAIAVKQYKMASTQGDKEFCAEVEVLSCAQHRNVVMLVGFCIEGKRRLLVYEFICNGSLDSHLYGKSGMIFCLFENFPLQRTVHLAATLLLLPEFICNGSLEGYICGQSGMSFVFLNIFPLHSPV